MSWDNLPFDSKEEAFTELRDRGFNEQAAEKVAETLAHEVEMDEGQPESLWQSIVDGAKNIISDLNLETFSWVENPAQRSSFVMMKDDGERFETSSPILKESKDDDWETVYAPVMVPGEKDKDEEAIPAHVIESSAHEFLAEGKVDQIDSDHNLITGKGTLVESWILKEDKEYNLPDGGTETYPKGTWMVGVQPSEEAKDRIESGELQGFSIFGEAEKVKLAQTLKSESPKNDTQEATSMGDDNDENVDLKQVADNIESVKEGLNELSDTVSDLKTEEPEIDAKEVSSFEDLVDSIKDDETELVEFGDEFKQVEMDTLVDLIEGMENVDADAASIAEALSPLFGEDEVEAESDDEDEEMDEDEKESEQEEKDEPEEKDEESEKEESEKSEDELTAKMDKGADTETVREENLEAKENVSDQSAMPSYKEAMQKEAEKFEN